MGTVSKIEFIHQSARSQVFFEFDHSNSNPLVWKVPQLDPGVHALLANEYDIASRINFSGVRTPIRKGVFQGRDGYCYTYFHGEPLAVSKIAEEDFIPLALQMVALLERLHEQGICHQSIAPGNLIFDPDSGQVRFIDLSFAGPPTMASELEVTSKRDEIRFIAPERLNALSAVPDHRADLYSLGMVFYSLLTGDYAYSATNPVDLIDEILSKPIHFPKSDISQPLIEMVGRLLHRDPHKRYQSCYSLWYDLDLIQKNGKAGSDHSIILGTQDGKSIFHIPDRLYGHQSKLDQLCTDFLHADRANLNIISLKGEAGIGKQSFVNHFKSFLNQEQIILIEGASNRSTFRQPQAGLIEALSQLGEFLLTESRENLESWKAIFLSITDKIGTSFFTNIASFEWIFTGNENPPDQNNLDLDSTEILVKIFEGISIAGIPLLIHLSGFHETDKATCDTLRALASSPQIHDLTFIVSFEPGHEQTAYQEQFWQESEMKDLILAAITLEAWTANDVQELTTSLFHQRPSADFANLMYRKTLGHPYFIFQLLQTIQKRKLVSFNYRKDQWEFKWDEISAIEVSQNVNKDQQRKIEGYTSKLQSVLSYAACIGRDFEVSILEHLLQESPAEVTSHLEILVAEAILETNKHGYYSFTSPHIYKYVLESIPATDKAKIHHKIASFLELNGPQNLTLEKSLAKAYHYNKIAPDVLQQNKSSVKNANYEAADLARKASFFTLSCDHFNKVIALIDEDDWQNNYEETLKLFHSGGEVAMVANQHTQGDEWLQTSLDRAKNVIDRIPAYDIKLDYFSQKHQFDETINLLLEVVEELGYPIKRNPGKATIMKEFARVLWLLRGKKITDLLDLPPMENPHAYSFTKLMVKSATSVFGSAPDILPVVSFREMQLSLRYGNCKYSPYVYTSFGFALSTFMKQIKKGYEFGKMALELVNKLKADEVRARVMVIFHGFLSYWREPLRNSLEPLLEAYQFAKKMGDLLYASFGLYYNSALRFYTGQYLPQVFENQSNILKEIREMNQDLVYLISAIENQMVHNLIEVQDDPLTYRYNGFDQEKMFEKLDEIQDQASKFDYYHGKLLLACIFNNYSEGIKFIDLANKYCDEASSRQITYPTFVLVNTLASYQHLPLSKVPDEVNKRLKDLKSLEKTMQLFAINAPNNFQGMLYFIQACRLQYHGKQDAAIKQYLASIEHAKKEQFIHLEALFREQLALYYIQTGKMEFGEMMLKKSFSCYKTWGARAKLNDLIHKHPAILRDESSVVQQNDAFSYQNVRDMNTIIASNKALASENSVEGLLNVMIRIIRENASTTYAAICLRNDAGVFELRASIRDEDLLSPKENSTAQWETLPQKVILYVARTKKKYAAANLSLAQQFTSDPYIRKYRPLSTLCIPLIVNNQPEGVVYLENNLQENLFNHERVEFFSTICAQLEVSLDNILVYTHLEDKVQERTRDLDRVNRELQSAKDETDQLLRNILPQETADELRRFGQTTAKRFPNVSVLFSDIMNFTKISETLSPSELVSDLDYYFKQFDEICLRNGLEKIKTIGDAYLAAGGIPESNRAGAIEVVRAALEMQQLVLQLKESRQKEQRNFYEMRIGVHTGPVVAGVVGLSKFQYDIWGDTVNMAARLQETATAGRVNVSAETHALIRDHFNCEYRGTVEAKNKGAIPMYFVIDEKTT